MKKDIINFILTLVGAIGAGVFIWFTDYYSFGLQIALICLLGGLIALEIIFYALKKEDGQAYGKCNLQHGG